MSENQILEDITCAKKIIEENHNHPKKNAQSSNYFYNLYSFTNENLTNCLWKHHFSNNRILTLGSSADQALSFIFKGASNVTILDINPFIKYYYELKKAAIFNLSRDEYLNFFCRPILNLYNRDSLIFNEQDYYKISSSLSQESKLFWESLFNEYTGKFIKKNLFMKDELSKKELIKNIPYLTIENYRLLPSKLEQSNLQIIQGNVLEINNIPNDYDVIYLSNVLDYLFSFCFTKNSENDYVMHDKIAKNYLEYINSVINKLTPHGILFFHYMWDIYNYQYKYYYGVDKIVKPYENITKLVFPGSYRYPDTKDSIYVYTKKIK